MKATDTLERVLPDLEARRGPFVFVGLFLREESPGQWDLVVSAPWLDVGKLKSFAAFVKDLSDAAGEDFVRELSRVVTLGTSDDSLRRILADVRGAILPVHQRGDGLFGLPVEEAYVLRAQSAVRNAQQLAPR